jgi:hypothetical protein
MAHGPIPDKPETGFYAARRGAYEAHSTDDTAAFDEHISEADRLGAEAWRGYFSRHGASADGDLASELRRLGFDPTPGQLRWLESALTAHPVSAG